MKRLRLLISPGLGDSGPKHWQSLWESSHGPDRALRVRRSDESWSRPRLLSWRAELDELLRAVDARGERVVVAAHSLGCLNLADWIVSTACSAEPERRRVVAGAMMVAPPNPERDASVPAGVREFADVVHGSGAAELSMPLVVVASEDDPFASLEFTTRLARRWGANRLWNVGKRGHVNADSGLGAWEEGWRVFEREVVLPCRDES